MINLESRMHRTKLTGKKLYKNEALTGIAKMRFVFRK